ncbi:MAG: hypothetical protein ACYC96_14540 [Fimbriimonadaceae bacterium]
MLHLPLLAAAPTVANPPHRNLIVNGDFSAGDKGFKSDYAFRAFVGPEGSYDVGVDPHAHHSGGETMGDHTTGHASHRPTPNLIPSRHPVAPL